MFASQVLTFRPDIADTDVDPTKGALGGVVRRQRLLRVGGFVLSVAFFPVRAEDGPTQDAR